MNLNRELKIAYGSSCFAKVWSNKTITFEALCFPKQRVELPHPSRVTIIWNAMLL